eukprot:TRINITY_DN6514_c0_g1_i1.p1 TRINITY_DN6514_c0_g1~~TRINITY_DN6514_c0_g1_i1.p1  ORF type:complete len:128 (+),score=18.63 TRINITY_DN6514_c0_g1_i1:157-540(+)
MYQEKKKGQWVPVAVNPAKPAPIPMNKVKWEYWVDDGVDGKTQGWYPYDDSAILIADNICSQWVKNNKSAQLSIRSVKSKTYQYSVDFNSMQQQNTQQKNYKGSKVPNFSAAHRTGRGKHGSRLLGT